MAFQICLYMPVLIHVPMCFLLAKWKSPSTPSTLALSHAKMLAFFSWTYLRSSSSWLGLELPVFSVYTLKQNSDVRSCVSKVIVSLSTAHGPFFGHVLAHVANFSEPLMHL